MKTYDYNNGNRSINFRRSKLFISFFIHNKSGHSEQITRAVMMIKNIFNDAEIGDVLSTMFGLKIDKI